jgi:hypothetical protein
MVSETFITIFGGLGNQLFQLSQALELSKSSNVKLVYPYSWAKGTFKDEYRAFFTSLGAPAFSSSKTLRFLSSVSTFLPFRVIQFGRLLRIEVHSDAYSLLEPQEKHASRLIHTGYFQNDIQVNNSGLALKIANLSKNPASQIGELVVHVRGGDFIAAQRLYGLLDREFYTDAIRAMGQPLPITCITNDKKYALDLLSPLHVSFSEGNGPLEDFFKAVSAQNFVGSNSTYSWWIAKTRISMGRRSVMPEPFFPLTSELKPDQALRIEGVCFQQSKFRN